MWRRAASAQAPPGGVAPGGHLINGSFGADWPAAGSGLTRRNLVKVSGFMFGCFGRVRSERRDSAVLLGALGSSRSQLAW